MVRWCKLDRPAQNAMKTSGTLTAFGLVFEPGVTEGPGRGEGIDVEAGYGAFQTSPADHASWTWVPASYSGDRDYPGFGAASCDEYMADMTVGIPGKYSFCFRFSMDQGPWRYADLDGTGNGFQQEKMGCLRVWPCRDAVISRILGRPVTCWADCNEDECVDIGDLIVVILNE